MPGIADSHAILDEDKLLCQHHAALTLLQQRLANPDVARFSWLDLACGKGQIFSQLDGNISPKLRSKIIYCGYDMNLEYVRITEQRAKQLAFQEVTVKVGELPRFSDAFGYGLTFDFITLTNTIHEIEPNNLATILFDALARLSDHGLLFVYDMEQLQTPELGAVPWKSSEIETVVGTLLSSIGVENYVAPVGHWRHSTVGGWNLQIENEHVVREAPNFHLHREAALSAVSAKIRDILQTRLRVCTETLESLTLYGSATGTEKDQETASLYEFWALQRALGIANE